MKNYFLVLALFICSCNGQTSDESNTEEVLQLATEASSNKADTLCFLKTAGATKQDTAVIQLVINNDKVTGKMMNLPHERDSRVGRINGVKDGDIITAKWTYMAEGMIDSVMVSYKLTGGNLLQKGSSFDPQTGKEVLPDTATYRILFEATECRNVPMINYNLEKLGL